MEIFYTMFQKINNLALTQFKLAHYLALKIKKESWYLIKSFDPLLLKVKQANLVTQHALKQILSNLSYFILQQKRLLRNIRSIFNKKLEDNILFLSQQHIIKIKLNQLPKFFKERKYYKRIQII